MLVKLSSNTIYIETRYDQLLREIFFLVTTATFQNEKLSVGEGVREGHGGKDKKKHC